MVYAAKSCLTIQPTEWCGQVLDQSVVKLTLMLIIVFQNTKVLGDPLTLHLVLS